MKPLRTGGEQYNAYSLGCIGYNDVIRSDLFGLGRRWTSPKSGASLIIVGEHGNADDPERTKAFFVVRTRLVDDDQYGDVHYAVGGRPHQSAHEVYRLAQRLDVDATWRSSNERICIPLSGEGAIGEVDLCGYGRRGESYPDGITGEEIIARERKEQPWRATIWPHPGRMLNISLLKPNTVISSEQFLLTKMVEKRNLTDVETREIVGIDWWGSPSVERDTRLAQTNFFVVDVTSRQGIDVDDFGADAYEEYSVRLLPVGPQWNEKYAVEYLVIQRKWLDGQRREEPFDPVEVVRER